LKLKHDKPVSEFAFKFNLRRYTVATIVLYPIGIFALFAAMLYSIRHALHTPAAQQVLVGPAAYCSPCI
jgi:hypothetical protein